MCIYLYFCNYKPDAFVTINPTLSTRIFDRRMAQFEPHVKSHFLHGCQNGQVFQIWCYYQEHFHSSII